MKDLISKSALIVSFIMLIGMLVNRDFRLGLGLMVDYLLHPLSYLKFYQTIFILSIVTGIYTNLIQKYTVDYRKIKLLQEKIFSYQKEYVDAMKKNYKAKIEKLEKMKPEIKQMQAELMNEQMRPMGLTLLVSLPIFTWIWEKAYLSYELTFGQNSFQLLESLPESFVSTVKNNLNSFFVKVPLGGEIHVVDAFIFPWWLWWYLICSIASGQIIKRVFKVGV